MCVCTGAEKRKSPPDVPLETTQETISPFVKKFNCQQRLLDGAILSEVHISCHRCTLKGRFPTVKLGSVELQGKSLTSCQNYRIAWPAYIKQVRMDSITISLGLTRITFIFNASLGGCGSAYCLFNLHGAIKSYTLCHLLTNYFHGEGLQVKFFHLIFLKRKGLVSNPSLTNGSSLSSASSSHFK